MFEDNERAINTEMRKLAAIEVLQAKVAHAEGAPPRRR